MITDTTHPHPTCVLAVDDGSPPSRWARPVASGLASRLGIPVRDVRPDEVDSLITEAVDARALLVAAVPSIGSMNPKARSLGRPLAEGSSTPWIAVGPSLREVHHPGPEELVVPLDGSPEADGLVPTVFDWAAGFGLAVRLVAVLPVEPQPVGPFCLDPGGHLERLVAADPHPLERVEIDLIRDPIGVASAMNQHLRHRPDALLLAPTTRARTGRALIDNNTPNSVVRHSPVPVLLVPPRA